MKKILCLSIIFLWVMVLSGQTTVTSNVSASTNWVQGGSPYIIADDVEVEAGVILTVEPGVTIIIEGNNDFLITGKLEAHGTVTDSIRIKGKPSTFGTISASLNYRGEIDMSYAVFDSMRYGIYGEWEIVTNPATYAGNLEIEHIAFTGVERTGATIRANASSVVSIDSSLFENCLYGITGDGCVVSNSIFRNNFIGVSGDDADISYCHFDNNSAQGIKVYLPFEARFNTFENHDMAVQMVLATFGTPNMVSYFEGNEILDNNKIGIHFYRDTGMVNSQNLVIQGNSFCADSINAFYDIAPGYTGNSYPLLDMANNCWCEWTIAASWGTISNPYSKAINIAPLDSTCLPSLVFPGDTDHDQVVNNFDLLPIGLYFGQTGPSRANASTNWVGQQATDWGSLQQNGRDIKHADCDGNGTIDGADTLAIGLNYGLTHNSWRKPATQGNYTLRFNMPTTNLLPGDTLSIPIELGTVDTPAVSIYGLAFSINYDPMTLDSAGVKLSYDNSWLGIKNTDMLTFDKDFYSLGQTDIAMVRTDQTSRSGYGMVGSVIIVISDDIAKKERPIELTFTNVRAIDSIGQLVDLKTEKGEAIVAIGTNQQADNPIDLKCYPNPAKDHFMLETQNTYISGVELFTLEGQRIQNWKVGATTRFKMNTSACSSGLYVVKIHTDRGTIIQKLVIQH